MPDPWHQLGLVSTLATNWSEIETHLNSSPLSITFERPLGEIVDSDAFGLGFGLTPGNRAAPINSLRNLAEQRTIRSGGHKYAVQTDVSRFFPSIYTHSIPWALHGKAKSKASARARSGKSFGDEIDSWLQRSKNGQTIGISIGPDTSHIVAEIVGVAIDKILVNEIGSAPSGYRHVDDFFFAVDSYTEGEKILAGVAHALREFELDINPAKTRIVSIDDLAVDPWRQAIQDIRISADRKAQRADIQRYFSACFSSAKRHPEDNVLKYAVRKLSRHIIKKDNWDIAEALLLRVAVFYPSALQYVVQLIFTYWSHKYPINLEKVRRVAAKIILDHAPYGHDFEVMWALWLLRSLNINPGSEIWAEVSTIRNSACALLALDLAHQFGEVSKLDTKRWLELVSTPETAGGYWLLSYEGKRLGWLNAANALWKAGETNAVEDLLNKQVTFYDKSAKLEMLFTLRDDANPTEVFEGDSDDQDSVTFSSETEEYIS